MVLNFLANWFLRIKFVYSIFHCKSSTPLPCGHTIPFTMIWGNMKLHFFRMLPHKSQLPGQLVSEKSMWKFIFSYRGPSLPLENYELHSELSQDASCLSFTANSFEKNRCKIRGLLEMFADKVNCGKITVYFVEWRMFY